METKSSKKSKSLAWALYLIVAAIIVALAVLGPNVAAWLIAAIAFFLDFALFVAYKNKEELSASQEQSTEYWKNMYGNAVAEKSSLEKENSKLENDLLIAKGTIAALEKQLEEAQEIEIPANEVYDNPTPQLEPSVDEAVEIVEEEEAPKETKKKSSKKSKK